MMSQLPVVIAGTTCLSGVTTWADQLRAVLADHPRYKLQLLNIGPETDGFDLCATTVEAAREVVRKLAPVILLPNYFWELFLSGFEPGVFCVGMCHADSDEQYYRPLSWYEPVIAKFIAVSRECTERLTQRIPCRSADITTLPYGIRVPRTLSRSYQNQPLRLIYAGRVTQLQKRVWDFVPLARYLSQANVPFEFDIIGEGDVFVALREEMQDRFPAGHVRCLPRLPHREMPGVWASHDVFLQVSDFEGTSVSMLEAMAHGVVPVVTAASSGISGVIQQGENGFVVPVGDMAAMAEVLARLAADRSLLETAGSAAHQSAQPYSLELYHARFTRFLDEVVQAGQEVDVHKRYGMFGGAHPMFKLRQLAVEQQQEIAHLRRGAIKRLLDAGYQNLRPSNVRTLLRDRRMKVNGR